MAKLKILPLAVVFLLTSVVWLAYINSNASSSSSSDASASASGRWFGNLLVSSRQQQSSSSSVPIAFVLTSPNQTVLDLRSACAVESAALHHPSSVVTLLSMASIADSDAAASVLRRLDNVVLEVMDVGDVLSDTPLHAWYVKGDYAGGSYVVTHTSDAVRLAVLWKQGGVYLDTDVIVLRPLSHLRNAIGLQSDDEVNGAVMAFAGGPRHRYVRACMEAYVSEYARDKWATQGPELLTRVLRRECPELKADRPLAEQVARVRECLNVDVLPRSAFYPFFYWDWSRFFGANGTSVVERWKASTGNETTYAAHLWNKLSHSTRLPVGGGSVLDVLFRENCPRVYRLMTKERDEFERQQKQRMTSTRATDATTHVAAATDATTPVAADGVNVSTLRDNSTILPEPAHAATNSTRLMP